MSKNLSRVCTDRERGKIKKPENMDFVNYNGLIRIIQRDLVSHLKTA